MAEYKERMLCFDSVNLTNKKIRNQKEPDF